MLDPAIEPMPERVCRTCRYWGRTEFARGWRRCFHPSLDAEGVDAKPIRSLPSWGCNQWAPISDSEDAWPTT